MYVPPQPALSPWSCRTQTEPFNAGWFSKSEGKSQAHFSKNLLNRFLPEIVSVLLRDLSHQEAIFTQAINCLLRFVVANISLMNTVKTDKE